MELSIYTVAGTLAGQSAVFPDEIYNIEPSNHAIYLDVRQYLDHQRQGTHKTKERGEVRGSTKKPWRQKGTGNARSGHKRSPLWRHGGTIFGPKPHTYGFKVNKNVKRLARRSAIAYKLKANAITVLQYPNFSSVKTKSFLEVLNNIKCSGKKTLFVTGRNDTNFYLAGRNIPKVHFVHANQLNTYDLVNVDHVVFIEDALPIINAVLAK